MNARLRQAALSLAGGALLCPLWAGPPTIFDYGQPDRSRPHPVVPVAQVRVEVDRVPVPSGSGGWITDREVSWYGPGFYGKRTACGLAYTKQLLGVAHRTLPCGTRVEFRYNGRTAIVPVVDRGPYVAGRIWDLSGGLCVYLNHCFTGPIQYRIVR